MNQPPLIFLGAFAALALSWLSLIVQPQLQLGRATPGTNVVEVSQVYPQMRPGLAQRGLQVYRSLGCAACHTQSVRQEGAVFDLVLTALGTNTADLVLAIHDKVLPDVSTQKIGELLQNLPATLVRHSPDKPRLDEAVKALDIGGAKATVRMLALGPDIERGWGRGRTVAADFLYDNPALPGSLRLGPDLANTGSRLPLAEWHYRHLYDPNSVRAKEAGKSMMPPYRFLFETQRAAKAPTPDAFSDARLSAAATLAGSRTNWVGAGGSGSEGLELTEWRVPTDDARALVAYLLNLRPDVALLERPLAAGPVESTNTPSASTNAVLPAAAATNAAQP